MNGTVQVTLGWATAALLLLQIGCSADAEGSDPPDTNTNTATQTAWDTPAAGPDPAGQAPSPQVPSQGPPPAPTDPMADPMAMAGGPAPAPNVPPAGPADPATDPAGPGDPVADPADPVTPPEPAGPEDGDPSAPIFAHPEVACASGGGGFGFAQPNHMIDGREMIVTYPCDKHEGAPMTFILNLHGTTPVNLHFYQHGYFSAHQFAASHNLIVVTPSSVVEQWGNGDNGQDEPHLMKIIDWVFSSFSGLDIRGMWVAGHSWGGLYTARFGCGDAIADKVKGLVLQSGGGVGGFGGASCGDRVSVIISTAEGDGRMPSDQSQLAGSHGCEGPQMETIVDINDHTFWPDCNPGFVHANYYMRMKEHATSMDREVVESIVDWIKLARQ